MKLWDLPSEYRELHRKYHGIDHIISMLKRLESLRTEEDLTEMEYTCLKYAIVYHDVIYDPYANNNEEASAVEVIKRRVDYINVNTRHIIVNMIQNTAISTYNSDIKPEMKRLVHLMRYLDLMDFRERKHLLMSNFISIMQEFQFVSYPVFQENNLNVIRILKDYIDIDTYIWYTNWIKSFTPRIGVFTGSFNPFHIGHMSILEQAERDFDKVIIMHPTLGPDGDALIRNTLPFHEIIAFDGLLINHLMKIMTYASFTMIRGLRDGYDLTYESKMYNMNQYLGLSIPTVYYKTDKDFISSTNVRDLMNIDKNTMEMFIPHKYDYYQGEGRKIQLK